MEKTAHIYHGSDHVLPTPLYGFGKQDNDYGSGFYTTADKEKAAEWAAANGSDGAYVNTYELNTDGLQIVNLDNYGTLAWIAEIVDNRGARGEAATLLARELIKRYKVDLSHADIVIGYRADDSYSDIVDAFLQNQLNIEEVERLFHKGNLGSQIFLKSELAFNRIKFCGYEVVQTKGFVNQDEITARAEVSKFLRQRNSQILVNGFQPYGITAKEAVQHYYEYDSEYQYYVVTDAEKEADNRQYEEEEER